MWLFERHSPREIADAIDIMMDFLNVLGGDPEAEPATWPEAGGNREPNGFTDDHEQVGDERDIAWAEWVTRGRHKFDATGSELVDRGGHEEDDDAAEDDDPAGGVEEAEPLTWPERKYQPTDMGGGLAFTHDEDEPRVPTTLNLDAANRP